jgi:hypothetical protein
VQGLRRDSATLSVWTLLSEKHWSRIM